MGFPRIRIGRFCRIPERKVLLIEACEIISTMALSELHELDFEADHK